MKDLIAQLRSLSDGLAGDPILFAKMKALLDAADELFCKLRRNQDFWDSLDDLARALDACKMKKTGRSERHEQLNRIMQRGSLAILSQFCGQR